MGLSNKFGAFVIDFVDLTLYADSSGFDELNHRSLNFLDILFIHAVSLMLSPSAGSFDANRGEKRELSSTAISFKNYIFRCLRRSMLIRYY